jgi:hypothetical protein
LTVSKYGAVSTRKADLTDKFVDRIFNSKSFTSIATTYGLENEKHAKQALLLAHPIPALIYMPYEWSSTLDILSLEKPQMPELVLMGLQELWK